MDCPDNKFLSSFTSSPAESAHSCHTGILGDNRGSVFLQESTKHQSGFAKLSVQSVFPCVLIWHALCFFVLTVNHLTPTGKKQSVCQEIIHQKHITSDICHIHVFVFRKCLLAGTSGNFPHHKVLCVFSQYVNNV